ncbi:MAG: hypothetical protein GXO11_03215 [Epsilonproteobacteria bacterium]|nr:hypothetical protein [Campylobacterota bacterium]
MKLLLALMLMGSLVFAKDNVSLAKTLMGFEGDEYNMLLFPMKVVVKGKKKKTIKAITKGYKRAIAELTRQVKLRDINLHLKVFTKRGSNLPQYKEQDIQSYEILKQMLDQQVSIREQLFEDSQEVATAKNQPANVTADEIDVDIDDSAFDISDDKVTLDNGSGGSMQVSPEDAFITGFVEMSELYNQEVLQLYKALHPFNVEGKPEMKPVHSVFGMAFFPTKYGSVKMMKIYVVLCSIGTEEAQSVQVIAKEIPNFKWDRNYLYISAATGKVLRQIIAGVLGESLE